MKGVCKWFNAQKGYGFITGEDGKDVFVHHSDIKMDGYKTLNEGDKVDFEVIKADKGMKAINVLKI